jgi:hypothetical protein
MGMFVVFFHNNTGVWDADVVTNPRMAPFWTPTELEAAIR